MLLTHQMITSMFGKPSFKLELDPVWQPILLLFTSPKKNQFQNILNFFHFFLYHINNFLLLFKLKNPPQYNFFFPIFHINYLYFILHQSLFTTIQKKKKKILPILKGKGVAKRPRIN
jgi:hypothetical protein